MIWFEVIFKKGKLIQTQILFESVAYFKDKLILAYFDPCDLKVRPAFFFSESSQMKSYIVSIKTRYDLHSTVTSTKLNGLIWGGWPRTLQTTLSTPFLCEKWLQ